MKTTKFGFYPLSQTHRPFTADESAVIAEGETVAARLGDHYLARFIRDSIASARRVAEGHKVSRQWIISDPVAALVERVAGHIAAAKIELRSDLPADAQTRVASAVIREDGLVDLGDMTGCRAERIGSTGSYVYLRHPHYKGSVAVPPSDPRHAEFTAVAVTV